jgi:hypothetical protein
MITKLEREWESNRPVNCNAMEETNTPINSKMVDIALMNENYSQIDQLDIKC